MLGHQLPRKAASSKLKDFRRELGGHPTGSPRGRPATGPPPALLDFPHRDPNALRVPLRFEGRDHGQGGERHLRGLGERRGVAE